MNIEYDNDHHVVHMPFLSWREMRAVIDWLDETEIKSIIDLGKTGMLDLHGNTCGAHGLEIHLYSLDDVIPFKLKWQGAVGR